MNGWTIRLDGKELSTSTTTVTWQPEVLTGAAVIRKPVMTLRVLGGVGELFRLYYKLHGLTTHGRRPSKYAYKLRCRRRCSKAAAVLFGRAGKEYALRDVLRNWTPGSQMPQALKGEYELFQKALQDADRMLRYRS